MIYINYYNEIKETLVKNEIYKKVKDYSKNRSDLNAYFEVGRLIVEAQGGEARAKYGNKLIKEYSLKLTKELGKGYNVTNLKNMRQFYLKFKNGRTMCDQLQWSHYRYLLPIDNDNEFDYYVMIVNRLNLSVRELRKKIKSNEYERIGYKAELEEPRVNTLIKNPILIKVKNKNDKLTEYALHKSILENMDVFLKELGVGFTYVGNEVKINIGTSFHFMKYINYVDKNIKELFNDKTVGVIICRKENKYVMEYCTDNRIFTTTYETI